MTHTTLYARDAALRRVGEVDDFDKVECVLRFNGVSTWVLDLDARSAAAAVMADAAGIVLVRDGITLLSGPSVVRRVTLESGKSRLMFAGVDDTVWLDRRLALPVPLGPPYTAQSHDRRTGPAEDVIRAYVDANAGPGASAARRVPGLALPASQGRGGAVIGNARFAVLLELAQALALVGGTGFRIVQVGAGLELVQYVPADRTRTASFSLGLGNLAGYTYEQTDPTATYAYVAGQGEGTARTIVEGGAVDPPYRAEVFRDQRDTNEQAALEQSRAEALTEGAGTTSLSLSPIDTDAVTFGRDYLPGDRVAVTVDGVTITDVVREVKLTLAPDGDTLVPVVGTPGASNPDVPTLFDTMRKQARRLSALERR